MHFCQDEVLLILNQLPHIQALFHQFSCWLGTKFGGECDHCEVCDHE